MEQNYNQILKEQSVEHLNNQIKENFIPNNSEKKSKSMYVLNLDGSRIFWLLSIILLLMTFVLLLGYWIGSDSAGYDSNNAQIRVSRTANTTSIVQPQQTNEREIVRQEQSARTETSNVETPRSETTNAERDTITGPRERIINNQDPNTEAVSRRESAQETQSTENTRVPRNPEINSSQTRTQISSRMRRLSKVRGVDTFGSDKFLTTQKPFTIQIATHFSLRTAKHIKRQLQRMDHSAYIFSHEGANGRKFYKIRVGTFKDRDSAMKHLATLKQSTYGREGIIIHR